MNHRKFVKIKKHTDIAIGIVEEGSCFFLLLLLLLGLSSGHSFCG